MTTKTNDKQGEWQLGGTTPAFVDIFATAGRTLHSGFSPVVQEPDSSGRTKKPAVRGTTNSRRAGELRARLPARHRPNGVR